MSEYRRVLKKEEDHLKMPDHLQRVMAEAEEAQTEAPVPSTASSSKTTKQKDEPFHRERLIYEQKKTEREKELAELRQQQEQEKQARKTYYEQRRRTQTKLMKRTGRGQPKLNKHIEHILSKLQKEAK